MTLRLVLPSLVLAAAGAHAFQPVLPTANDALFGASPRKFYMYVERDFEGRKTQPWEGGTYGFSRGPERIGGKVHLAHFHEGIDVAPLRRDAAGEPLDEVRAIEAGRVVHASGNARDSNYGKYVVVQHDVGGAPVFSIYAHLAAIDVEPGQSLARGTRIGRIGWTGAGINRERAHLHLEIAILWNDGFETWHAANFPTPNKHGIFNGMNLMGLDVAGFYKAQNADPGLTLQQFIARTEPFFRVRIPESPRFQLPRRYPWLVRGRTDGVQSWVVSFTAAGFPVSIEPSSDPSAGPVLEWAKPSKLPYRKVTRSLLDGPPGKPRLGANGLKWLQLLSWDPSAAPVSPAPEGNQSGDDSATLRLLPGSVILAAPNA